MTGRETLLCVRATATGIYRVQQIKLDFKGSPGEPVLQCGFPPFLPTSDQAADRRDDRSRERRQAAPIELELPVSCLPVPCHLRRWVESVSGSCDAGSGCKEMVLCDETIMMTPLFDVISRCDSGEFSQLTRDLRLRR